MGNPGLGNVGCIKTWKARMRYLILGAGALGGYFGSRLARNGTDVTFLVRPRRAAQLAASGLAVKAKDGEIRMPVETVLAGAAANHYDIILLCCKAYDLDDAMTAIAPAVGPDSAILPVLNGMRHMEVLSNQFGARRVLGGLTLVNTVLTPDGEIVQSQVSLNTISCGEQLEVGSARCEQIKRDFVAAGVEMSVSSDIIRDMWGKFVAMAGSSAIAVLTRARASAVATAPAGTALVSSVIDECGCVVAARGYPAPAAMTDLLRTLWSNRESNYGPSMLVDIENGNRTEGEHIIGDMVRLAEAERIPVPVLTAALCSVQAYETQRLARGS
jgi:2-dehydropantoate 2-reductase